MTGGAGFISSANKSSKDNRNLAKIRPKATRDDGISRAENMDKADLKSIEDSINFRMSRRNSYVNSGYFFAGIVTLIILWILYILFF
ncbi:hypothetical protein SAMN04489724_2406 [Algoriphagus locisalis]|uniref:Uncharacterized protein n=1 Tax=Algoriphagus locisalis TaxID=305507 RepID=A0A1I7BGL5_9BACT|nr:hypothetical protein [Algoriphagus locisalis]SFT86303.1 hypothetical protein SAMN04489724_2406 [Algoriphagus locisalis]